MDLIKVGNFFNPQKRRKDLEKADIIKVKAFLTKFSTDRFACVDEIIKYRDKLLPDCYDPELFDEILKNKSTII